MSTEWRRESQDGAGRLWSALQSVLAFKWIKTKRLSVSDAFQKFCWTRSNRHDVPSFTTCHSAPPFHCNDEVGNDVYGQETMTNVALALALAVTTVVACHLETYFNKWLTHTTKKMQWALNLGQYPFCVIYILHYRTKKVFSYIIWYICIHFYLRVHTCVL